MSSEALEATATGNWGLLRAGAQPRGGLEIPTIPTEVSTVSGPVRLAIGPNEEPRVLLPLADQEEPATIPGGTALSISVSSFNHKGQILRFLDLICLSPDLESVFGDVVDEMLARIACGESCATAAQSTIEDFRSLLMRASGTEVDRGKIAGLIAELLVLNRLLDRSPSGWRAWRGPARDRHDFRAGDTSLELKASLRLGASYFTINGLGQLEIPTGGTLHLLRIVIEPVSNGVLSVSSLARNAISKSDEPDKVRELLAAVGCSDVDAQGWNRHKFRIDSEYLYEIRPGFPRLTISMLKESNVPHGVYDVAYKVDLTVAAPFLCNPAELADLEDRLCS